MYKIGLGMFRDRFLLNQSIAASFGAGWAGSLIFSTLTAAFLLHGPTPVTTMTWLTPCQSPAHHRGPYSFSASSISLSVHWRWGLSTFFSPSAWARSSNRDAPSPVVAPWAWTWGSPSRGPGAR